ncbi:MAG: adenylate/guanylate cyclase domain-containing protein [Alphaproteobacteria bacterium]|nr:adenylate/guanylate cyclase domain-containing protein [Alphaproteobacteria bacterium]
MLSDDPLLDGALSEVERARLSALLDGLRDQGADTGELAGLVERLLETLTDVELLYTSVLEHSTGMENELSAQNERITGLMDNMRRYLSHQLFQLIVGGQVDASTRHRRRRLTIFFSDLVGFTALTDSVEAEVLAEMLNSYLDRMAAIAIRWGGTIDKFIGDAVMVFFGDSDDADPADEALRCVRMALEMQTSMEDLQEGWRRLGIVQPLRTRMGINTGHCTVGNFGSEHRMDYTVVGGQVNVASRLEGLAPPGGVLISGATHALVRDAVECVQRGTVQVKGVHQPIETWEVVGLLSEQPTSGALAELEQGGFALESLRFDPEQTTAIQRAELERLLKRALSLLER